MKKICEADTSTKISKSKVVANPIDINLFKYTVKNPEKRTKILLIRSFGSKKYATDIATNAIMLLSTQPFFNQLHFTIVGGGKFYDKHTNKLKAFSIDDINKGFIKVINDENYRNGLIEKGYKNRARFSSENIGHQYADLSYKIAGK
jgi:hypothetical protein